VQRKDKKVSHCARAGEGRWEVRGLGRERREREYFHIVPKLSQKNESGIWDGLTRGESGFTCSVCDRRAWNGCVISRQTHPIQESIWAETI
jgi:hypothetical protein